MHAPRIREIKENFTKKRALQKVAAKAARFAENVNSVSRLGAKKTLSARCCEAAMTTQKPLLFINATPKAHKHAMVGCACGICPGNCFLFCFRCFIVYSKTFRNTCTVHVCCVTYLNKTIWTLFYQFQV